jgi:hypothetical protein
MPRNVGPLFIATLAVVGGALSLRLLLRPAARVPETTVAIGPATPEALTLQAPAKPALDLAEKQARDGALAKARHTLSSVRLADLPAGRAADARVLLGALQETTLEDDGRGPPEKRCEGFVSQARRADDATEQDSRVDLTAALALVRAFGHYPKLPDALGEPCGVSLLRAAEAITTAASSLDEPTIHEASEAFLVLVPDARSLGHMRGTSPADCADRFLREVSFVVIPPPSTMENRSGGTLIRLRPPESWPRSWEDWWSWASKHKSSEWRQQALVTARAAASDKRYSVAERATRLKQWQAFEPMPAKKYGHWALCYEHEAMQDAVALAVCSGLK